jgi:sterol 3beta-glucosyltransferase
LPDDVCVIEAAPHEWLFPRMAAVVHHGGAGTTAEGLRAGRPTVICPTTMNDQLFWDRRVSELGVGPEPIPQKKLTAETLLLRFGPPPETRAWLSVQRFWGRRSGPRTASPAPSRL